MTKLIRKHFFVNPKSDDFNNNSINKMDDTKQRLYNFLLYTTKIIN
jgi:hypothetical protein